ncbi:Carboxypeptidase G2 precursor [Vibrio mangrovi]|nr:Carboxypeptidase G2 precursor [Vibrio mangrovi]
MERMLAWLVNCDSFSHDRDDVCAIARQVCHWLTEQRIENILLEEQDTCGVLAWVGGSSDKQPVIFLTGHLDTVFPRGTAGERPYSVEGEKAYGPGVADMKAGVMMNCFVLAALQQLEQESGTLLPFTVKMLLTVDEEIGSPRGRALIERYIQGAQAVLNAEPGRISGNVVAARKGGAVYQIDVSGRAAHAGVSHQDGVSAVEALVRIIQKIHQLTDYEQGLTTNVGVISGGLTPNTVAESAQAKVDIRFKTQAQGEFLHQALQTCLESHYVEGASARMQRLAYFLPLEPRMSQSLLEVYQQEAASLGELNITGEFTGGCSDAGWTAAMGIPTLCATGPVGAYMHTTQEFCDLGTLVKRAQIVARCCLRVGLGKLVL